MLKHGMVGGGRAGRSAEERRGHLLAGLLFVVLILLQGFVGYLEQEPVVLDPVQELYADIPRDVAERRDVVAGWAGRK